MEKLKSTCFFMIIAFIVLATETNSQQVDVTPNVASVREGESVDLLCRAAVELNYCRIVIPNEQTLVLSDALPSQRPGFKYFGNGLKAGQCGVTIESVRATQNGQMKCFLGSIMHGEVDGSIDISVALAPLRPEIELPPNSKGIYEANTEFRALCISRDGRPAANLTWFMGDEQIADQSTQEIISINNTSLFTSRLGISRFLRAEDDRKDLICRAYHFALPQKYEEVKTQVIVRYSPQAKPQTNVYGLVLGQTSFITVQIHANPRPQTQWIIDGQAVQQGTRVDRYESKEPEDLGGGVYNVSMTIADLTLEDTTKTYTLKANNEFGVMDYLVRISSLEAAPETSMEIGAIIGIVVGVAVILIIVVIVVIARVTGKWCFAGGTLRTDIGLDSEAQVANNYDDNEKDHEEFHPHENGQPNSTEVTDELKHEPQKNGNGVDANKTNTSV